MKLTKDYLNILTKLRDAEINNTAYCVEDALAAIEEVQKKYESMAASHRVSGYTAVREKYDKRMKTVNRMTEKAKSLALLFEDPKDEETWEFACSLLENEMDFDDSDDDGGD